MKKLLFGSVAAIALASAGAASTAAASPAYGDFNWGGMYIGANGGEVWRSTDSTSTNTVSHAVTTGSTSATGWLAGGQLGYNWLASPTFLLGVEGDIDGTGLSSHHSDANAITSERTNLISTVRGRAGFTSDNWLFYGTGGGAFHSGDGSRTDLVAINNAPAGAVEHTSFADWGWTAGGGVEWGFAPRWTMKIEDLYMQFDNHGVTPLSLISTTSTGHLNTLKIGVNFLF